MGSLSSAKTLGGVGGILVFFPFVSLVGWILILLATKEISETVQDKSIFDDALLAAITAIIGAVVFVAFIVTGSIAGLFTFGLGFPSFYYSSVYSERSGFSQSYLPSFSSAHTRRYPSD